MEVVELEHKPTDTLAGIEVGIELLACSVGHRKLDIVADTEAGKKVVAVERLEHS